MLPILYHTRGVGRGGGWRGSPPPPREKRREGKREEEIKKEEREKRNQKRKKLNQSSQEHMLTSLYSGLPDPRRPLDPWPWRFSTRVSPLFRETLLRPCIQWVQSSFVTSHHCLVSFCRQTSFRISSKLGCLHYTLQWVQSSFVT